MRQTLNDVFLIVTNSIALIAMLVVLGLIILTLIVYVRDRFQHAHSLRRNYPVIGRFRYWFEHLGTFFRQYFFAMDREELPFNRAERSWVYRAAKDQQQSIAFGSTRRLKEPGAFMFLNSPFPVSRLDTRPSANPVIGEGSVPTPYQPQSLFNISGMSFGALSRPAIQALAGGAKQAGVWLNTGEGGVSPYHLSSGCDLVVQIGTAKYGIRNPAGDIDEVKLKKLGAEPNVRLFEIKLSQGAKPGKGGILPAIKVTDEIARIRGIAVHEDSISPNGHKEITSVVELLDFIDRIRRLTGKPVGIKFVLGSDAWLDDFFGLILERGLLSAPDFITLDAADGGSGAAPQTLMDFVGLPLQKSLPILVDKLCEYGLRERVKVIASGKLLQPSAIAWALCLGADYVVSARGFMFAVGCIQAMQCNKNTCPTGVATHDRKLQRGLDPDNKAKRVAQYIKHVQQELTTLAHSCGLYSATEFTRDHVQIMVDGQHARLMRDIYPTVSQKHYVEGVVESFNG